MTKNIHAIVGERIREERKKANLTIEQLAEMSGISSSFLGYIETKGRKASLETIERVAKALRVQVGDLFRTVQGPKKAAAGDASLRFVYMVRDKSRAEQDAILDVVKTMTRMFARKKAK